ncbi:MAG: arginine N-succinyltransferase [Pseudomonadota bacterium]|nr:arginine N-succinyltransferase [Pseudomonadota bacterium]
MILRPVAHHDLDALLGIAEESGPGFTSLTPDRRFLAERIEHSIASFATEVTRPSDEVYLFVLEDTATGALAGTTGIRASVGHNKPVVHFRHTRVLSHTRTGKARTLADNLTPCQHYQGCTEICSLYLRPDYHRAHVGKLLSRVRFLFMALHPHRFADKVIAQMRGVSTTEGEAPLWDSLRHLADDVDFVTATAQLQADPAGFVQSLPHGLLPTERLSPAARAVLGQVHPDTRPALHLLEQEGFRCHGLMDLLDGGPTVECSRQQIASVRNTRRFRWPSTNALVYPGILANTGCADFRATTLVEAPSMSTLARLNLAAGAAAAYLPLPVRASNHQHPHTTREASHGK